MHAVIRGDCDGVINEGKENRVIGADLTCIMVLEAGNTRLYAVDAKKDMIR